MGDYTSPFRFNAKELDEEPTERSSRTPSKNKISREQTGNYYYGARYYNPKWSLWLGVDPMASERSWLTPYNFVSNNPITRIDPDGMLDDHWEIDGKGIATLIDTEGDEIYVNGQLITDYNFNSQSKLDGLSQIATHYYNQNSDSPSLFNNKVSVLSYKDNKMVGSSNWDLNAKPYNNRDVPLAFAYSKKQYGTSSNRIALTVDNGRISSLLGTKWNMRSAFGHEAVHIRQPLDDYDYNTYAAYFELDAYKAQMQHSTWNKTTIGFQTSMLSNTEYYLRQLKGSNNAETQKRFREYSNFFNSKK